MFAFSTLNETFPASDDDDEAVEKEEDEEGEKDPDKLFSVIISIKSFLKFLNSHVVSTTTIACESCRHSSSLDLVDSSQVYVNTIASSSMSTSETWRMQEAY